MITIQGFAKLCGCNTQTLRYYDRIGLLAPAKVDQWTGYRYYEEEQAMLFVKIKNLQMADFSIEEIKTLLNEDEDHLMAAFDRKIREQKEALKAAEQAIARAEKEAGQMEAELADPEIWKDPDKAAETTRRYNALKDEIERLYEQYDALESSL